MRDSRVRPGSFVSALRVGDIRAQCHSHVDVLSAGSLDADGHASSLTDN
jgi:hypothetical protein